MFCYDFSYFNELLNCFFFQSSIDRMMQRGNASMMVGASSWKDQFLDAFTVQAGDDDEEGEEGGEEGMEIDFLFFFTKSNFFFLKISR